MMLMSQSSSAESSRELHTNRGGAPGWLAAAGAQRRLLTRRCRWARHAATRTITQTHRNQTANSWTGDEKLGCQDAVAAAADWEQTGRAERVRLAGRAWGGRGGRVTSRSFQLQHDAESVHIRGNHQTNNNRSKRLPQSTRGCLCMITVTRDPPTPTQSALPEVQPTSGMSRQDGQTSCEESTAASRLGVGLQRHMTTEQRHMTTEQACSFPLTWKSRFNN